MSQTIKIPNYSLLNQLETSQLNADAVVGATALGVNFSNNLAANDYLVLGSIGGEDAELVTISTVTDASHITTSALTKPHSALDRVTKLFGNQIKVYRAANVDGSAPADSGFASIATFSIDVDNVDTTYTDAAGSDAYWYKFTYYNSATTSETAISEASPVRGGGYGNYCSLESIINVAGLHTNRYISQYQVDQARQAAQDEIDGALIGRYTIPFTDPVPEKIRDITTRLAAGLLLIDIGSNSPAAIAQGEKKRDAARADLMAIQSRTSTVVQNGQSLATSSSGGFSMYPDADSASLTAEEGGRKFTSDMRY